MLVLKGMGWRLGLAVMKTIRLSELDLSRLIGAPLANGAREIVLPSGAGSLSFNCVDLAPGVTLSVRRGTLTKRLEMSGRDGTHTELALSFGTVRQMSLDGKAVLSPDAPALSVYRGMGAAVFEIAEDPTPDASFLEFSFAPGAAAALCPALDSCLRDLLARGRRIEGARLFSAAIPLGLSGIAAQIASGGGPLAIRRDAFAALDQISDTILGHGPTRLSRREFGQLCRLRDLLDAAPAQDHSLDGLARVAGMSRASLARKFPLAFGETVFEYLRRSRLEAARQLLERDGATVAEAARHAGFSHIASFSNAFREAFGEAPSNLRRG